MIYFGDTELLGLKIGNTDISAVYAGDLLIYPTTVTAWSVSPSTIEANSVGGSETIRIASLSSWTISADENWVSFSQNSGDSGRTTVTVTISSNAGTARTATITVTDGTNVSTISVLQKATGTLPSNTFLINYNAKLYNSSTYTIPKTSGQLFDYDMVLNAAASAYTTDYITVNGQYFEIQFASTGANPFNLTSASPFTIVAKTSRGLDSSGEHTIASCRDGGLNWILFNPGNNSGVDKVFMHNSKRLYSQTPYATITTEPNIYAIRINNGSGYGQSITDNTTERSIAVNYNGTSSRFGIFTDAFRMGGFELWRGDFYWIYISKEALTDNEILQVIDYNENL